MYVYAITECVAYTDKGVRVVTHVDEPWLADDPAVLALPHLFRDDPENPRGTVEQATAAPGQTRATKRAAKRG